MTSVIIKSPGSGIVWRDVPPGVLRKILRPGLGLHPPTTRPGEEETPAGRRVGWVVLHVVHTRQGLVRMLYPSAVGCNPCYLTLHGIGCGVTGPLVLVDSSLEYLGS